MIINPNKFKLASEGDFSHSLSQGPFKVMLIGDKGVGISTFRDSYIKVMLDNPSLMTIGVEFGNQEITVMGVELKFQWWISYFEERFRFLLSSYIHGSSLIILMFDITNKNTLTKVSMIIEFLKNVIGSEIIPIILVGNKLDRCDKRELATEGVISKYRNDISAYVEVSSLTGENIDLFFELITRYLMSKIGNKNHLVQNVKVQDVKKARRKPREITINKFKLNN